MSNEYEAGSIRVRGVDVPIWTNDSGDWIARPVRTRVSARTREALKTEIAKALRAADVAVAIPFITTGDTYGKDMDKIRTGTAYGRHANGNVLVEWEDGTKSQLSVYGYGRELNGTTADPAVYQQLMDAHVTAEKALNAYVKEHRIDLARVVRTAMIDAIAERAEQDAAEAE